MDPRHVLHALTHLDSDVCLQFLRELPTETRKEIAELLGVKMDGYEIKNIIKAFTERTITLTYQANINIVQGSGDDDLFYWNVDYEQNIKQKGFVSRMVASEEGYETAYEAERAARWEVSGHCEKFLDQVVMMGDRSDDGSWSGPRHPDEEQDFYLHKATNRHSEDAEGDVNDESSHT